MLLLISFQCAIPLLSAPFSIVQTQSDAADDYVGTYQAEDTVIVVGSSTDTTYRSYTFTIVKIDSNHVAFYDFDDCAQDYGFSVSSNTFLYGGVPNNCGYYCSQPRGDKVGNTLYYKLTKCFGAPIDITIFGKATKLPQNIVRGINVPLFTAYPNPCKSRLNFSSLEKSGISAKIELYDLQGKQILSQDVEFNQGKSSIDVSQVPAAVYVWHIRTEKYFSTGKFSKIN